MESTTAYTGLDGVQVASLLVGVLLPILVGLVTKRSTDARLKSVLLLALAGVSGFLTEYINNADSFVWQQALVTALVTFVIGVAMHYGLWKPTGVASAAQGSLVRDESGYMSVERLIVIVILVALVVFVLTALF